MTNTNSYDWMLRGYTNETSVILQMFNEMPCDFTQNKLSAIVNKYQINSIYINIAHSKTVYFLKFKSVESVILALPRV